jgi:hypothetical protein
MDTLLTCPRCEGDGEFSMGDDYAICGLCEGSGFFRSEDEKVAAIIDRGTIWMLVPAITEDGLATGVDLHVGPFFEGRQDVTDWVHEHDLRGLIVVVTEVPDGALEFTPDEFLATKFASHCTATCPEAGVPCENPEPHGPHDHWHAAIWSASDRAYWCDGDPRCSDLTLAERGA